MPSTHSYILTYEWDTVSPALEYNQSGPNLACPEQHVNIVPRIPILEMPDNILKVSFLIVCAPPTPEST